MWNTVQQHFIFSQFSFIDFSQYQAYSLWVENKDTETERKKKVAHLEKYSFQHVLSFSFNLPESLNVGHSEETKKMDVYVFWQPSELEKCLEMFLSEITKLI